jgi:hypothetical protein
MLKSYLHSPIPHHSVVLSNRGRFVHVILDFNGEQTIRLIPHISRYNA